ncbi:MAG TPA: HlyD family efflux transporter periplasmic adaptor subunit, partial [Chloroflexota bacterium]|nr:HlyD family efflux transporter periplasmic adaptor subunit [Chloroflexota bacterium]
AAYQEIIGLANPARLIIEAVVPEVDQPSLSVGQPVEITMDAFAGVVITGRVTTLPRNIVSTTGQTVKIPETIVDGDFDRAGMDIGMLARLKIVVQVKEGVLKVPLTAVRTVNNRDFVETIIDGQRRSLPVTVGIQSDTEIEILDGLEEGQQIFASP